MHNIVLVFTFFTYIFAASISGTIKDQKTGEPLPFANIIIENTDIGTASDINGYYIFPKI